MAFVRCWAEGLDLTAAWDRYLYVDGTADVRRARSELQRLRDELAGLARAHGRPRIAALLRRDPDAITGGRSAAPTLEAFRDQQPPDFHSEAELVALYESAFGRGAAGPAQRRQRLRERLVLALHWLEGLAARDPAPADPLSAWLDERIAARLARAGLHCIADLTAHIALRGFHWHRGVARLGPQGAARVVRWLRDHESTLGALPLAARVPRSRLDTRALTPPAATGIVPLERFVVAHERDGHDGSNRAPPSTCLIAAGNDPEAVRAWLAQRVPGTHTWRAYRKEAERFLLWAVIERRTALSSLTGADCAAYRTFLAAPGAAWTGPRRAQRWSPAWRPFEAGLSPGSAATAATIVRSLCAWLVRQGYLAANPWHGVAARRSVGPTPPLRAFAPHEWAWVQGWLDGLPPSPAGNRLRFILDLAGLSGLRLSELAAAQVGWLRAEPGDGGAQIVSLRVPGLRAKRRCIVLDGRAVESFRDHLTDRGLDREFSSNDPATPLIARLDRNTALTASRIYEVLVAAFRQCAAAVAGRDKAAAERIRAASTHWLRHTHGVRAAAGGEPLEALRARLGHERRATVSVYAKALAEVQDDLLR